jgi:GT2 family glycosyltransferase
MPGRPCVSVAIANWNGASCVAACLEAVYGQSEPPAEVVVVDNGSTDGSPDTIARQFPKVRLVRLPRNTGFCAGYNLALREGRFPYVLILNTDVFLDRDFLLAARESLETAPDVGSVAARVLRADGSGVDYEGRFLRRRIGLVNGPQVEGGPVFAGSGAAIFCRRAMLLDIAFEGEVYDEAFFAYFEDLDLFWRAHARGWRCLYAPKALARHVGSASMGGRIRVMDKPELFQRHIVKNRYLAVIKNATPGTMAALFPFLVGAEVALWAAFLVKQPRRVGLLPEAARLTWRLLPRALRWRRAIQARRVTTGRALRALLRGI